MSQFFIVCCMLLFTVQMPTNSTSQSLSTTTDQDDIHICGSCKQNFTDINCFIEHKRQQCCGFLRKHLSDTGATSQPVEPPPVFRVFLESRQSSQLTAQQESRLIRQHLRAQGHTGPYFSICRSDETNEKDGNASSDETQDIAIQQPQHSQRKIDDEDVAAILANQFSSVNPTSLAPLLEEEEEEEAEEILGNSPLPESQNAFSLDVTDKDAEDQRSSNHDESSSVQTEIVIEQPLELSLDNIPEADVIPNGSSVVQPSRVKKRFLCNEGNCSFSGSYLKDLVRHTRTHTGERNFKCTICPRAFSRSDKLQLHQRIHDGIKSHCCSLCNYAAVDSGSLRKHYRIHNGERPFQCQICSYRSRDSSQLTVHLRRHTGDNPFVCPYESCTSAFKTSSDLKRHSRTHSGLKPFSCDICDYRCAVKSNLRVHININHTVNKLVKCTSCDHVSSSTRTAKEHSKLHAAEILQCGVCNFSCINIAGMRNHLKIHSSDKPLICKLCFYSCRHQSNLKRHMRSRHSHVRPIKKDKTITDSLTVPDKDNTNSTQRGKPLCFKTHQCTLCEAAFVRLDSLRSHVRSFHKPHNESEQVIAPDIVGEPVDFALSDLVYTLPTNNNSTYERKGDSNLEKLQPMMADAIYKGNDTKDKNKDTASQQQILSSSALQAQPMYVYLQNECVSDNEHLVAPIIFSNPCGQYLTIPGEHSTLVEQLSVSLQGGVQYVLSGPLERVGDMTFVQNTQTSFIEASVSTQIDTSSLGQGIAFQSEESTVIKKFGHQSL